MFLDAEILVVLLNSICDISWRRRYLMALFGSFGKFIESKENWSQYVERFEQFAAANDIADHKKAVFLATIGPAAYRTLGNLCAPKKPPEEEYMRLIEHMSTYYNPKPLVTMQRYRFYSRFCQPDESVPAFVAELKHLAKDCDIGAALEDNLRDRLVCGISDCSLQKILLSEQKLTFKRAFELAQSHESAAKDMAMLQTSSSQEVHKLKDSPSQCYSCGQLSHCRNQCKFRNSTCYYCGKHGHIQTVCRSRKSSNSSSSTSSQPHSKSESTSSSYTRHRSSRPSRNRLNQLPPSDIKTITDKSVTEIVHSKRT